MQFVIYDLMTKVSSGRSLNLNENSPLHDLIPDFKLTKFKYIEKCRFFCVQVERIITII